MEGYKHLAREQRYALKILPQAGDLNKTQIAAHLGVHKSTITRELQRNSDGRGRRKYNDDLAQRKYEKRMKQRPHTVRFTEDMKSEVRRLIVQEQYSPEQIHGRFTLDGNDMVCHETIYQWVYACKRRGDREMADNLRRRCKKYARRGKINRARGIIKDRVDISQRPAEVDAKNLSAIWRSTPSTERNSPLTRTSRRRWISASSSQSRTTPGKEEPTRIRMGWHGSTYPKVRTSMAHGKAVRYLEEP